MTASKNIKAVADIYSAMSKGINEVAIDAGPARLESVMKDVKWLFEKNGFTVKDLSDYQGGTRFEYRIKSVPGVEISINFNAWTTGSETSHENN